jgi:hydrogenase 3 maturation protease
VSPQSDKKDLAQALDVLLLGKRTVLLGIGQPEHGDDAFGCLLAEQLGSQSRVTSIICEELPENFTGVVSGLKPQTILLLDAVDFKGQPGQAVLIRAEELVSVCCSSHHASLQPLMRYLSAETGAEVRLLGIQPRSVLPGTGLSREVLETLFALQTLLSKGFNKTNKDES